jgi:hypothetical protein
MRFKEMDKSGATTEEGKFLTIFQRKGGTWMIIRDTWNSDAPNSQTASPEAVGSEAEPKK